jgi:ribosome-associated protein
MQTIDFELRSDFITLDALLKATGLAGSGGGAKAMVASGKVQLDGREELRKTCKVRAGQVVGVHGARVRVLAPATPAAAPIVSAGMPRESTPEEGADVPGRAGAG